MKSRYVIFFFSAILSLQCLSACSAALQSSSEASYEDGAHVFALVAKSKDNNYNYLMAEGFREAIESCGEICVISYPEDTTAEAQLKCVKELISQRVDSISVAANDEAALSDQLQNAMRQGIKITTLDSDVNANDRLLFVNPTDTDEIALELVEAVYDITGGDGQWAILSATSRATNQNTWIKAIREILEEDRYKDLRLVDIVFGNDDFDLSKEMTEKLLAEYPELEAICAPTAVGIAASAQVLTDNADTSVKVTGLGLPMDMAEYVKGPGAVCPEFFLWSPKDVGTISAYASMALVSGDITGELGDTFPVEGKNDYTVEQNEEGASQVIACPPIEFDATNIDGWISYFNQ